MDFVNIDELSRSISDVCRDPTPPLLESGGRVGYWTVLAFLGGGGFGEVYRVRHNVFPVIRALKILRTIDGPSLERFRRESEFLAAQTSLRFPRFYEAGEHAGRPYVVMELLEARDLPSSDGKVASYILGLCETLKVLHGQGLVHRDIKPSNVLFRENGDVVLSDYGLVKSFGLQHSCRRRDSELTRAGLAVGTSGFAAPEQLAGEWTDSSADVHSLGVLASACFNGRPPLRWARIIQRATSSLPAQRYSSVEKMEFSIRYRFAREWVVAGVLLLLLAASLLGLAAWIQSVRKPTGVEDVGHRDEHLQVSPMIRGNASPDASEWL